MAGNQGGKMSDRIIPADRELRRKVVAAVMVFSLIGAGLVFVFAAYVGKVSVEGDPETMVLKVRNMVMWLAIVNALASIAISSYLFLLAVRTYRTEQYPPERTKVIKDTPVRTGRRARYLGVLLGLTGIVILCTNILTWYLFLIVDRIVK